MKILAAVAILLLITVIAGVWFAKKKLASMGYHLPGALKQWEEEIKVLEKPKG